MKQGITMPELASQLIQIKETAKDYVVPTETLEVDSKLNIGFQNGSYHSYKPSSWVHSQLADYAKVPKQYYDRLKVQNTELLAKNINNGLYIQSKRERKDGNTESRMIRTVGGDNARAMVSSSFRRLDSYDVLTELLPIIQERPDLQLETAQLTEKRLYLKCLFPKLEGEVKKDDPVQYGLMISNSDVGSGALRIEPLIYRLVCLNGLVMNTAFKKFHVGRNQAQNEAYELFSESTKELTDAAFWAQAKDTLKASMDPAYFERQINELRDAADRKVTKKPAKVVELAMKTVGISGENNKKNILESFVNGSDGAGMNQWGLVNAITYAAQQDNVSFDDSVDMERAASKILTLTENQWQRIAVA